MIHQLKPGAEASDEYLALQRTIAADLSPRVATVIPVPYDGHLEGGDRIDYAALAEETRAAYQEAAAAAAEGDRKSTRLNSSHVAISYAVLCLKKKLQSHFNL